MNKTKLLFAPILIVPFLLGCGGGPKEYTITWKNWDNSILSETKVKENEMPVYDKPDPTREEDPQYTYDFIGWTPEIVKATADATYTATFTPVALYEISWYNDIEETKLLHSEKVKAGDTPTYHWEDKPTKDETERKRYDWKGEWEEEIKPASASTKYHAKFQETNKYEITFQDEDETELQISYVAEGELPIYTEEIPTKTADGNFYIFDGWDSEVVAATCDKTYTATYDEGHALTASFTVDTSKGKSVNFTLENEATIDIVDWGDGTTDKLNSHTYTDSNKAYNVKVSSSDTTTFSISYCWNVTSITLSNQITSIGENAFGSCNNVETFNVSDSIKSVAWNAFGERDYYPTGGLKFTNIDPNEPDLWYLGNESNPYVVLFWDGTDEGGEETYTINSNCKVIAEGSLNGNGNLTSITIPDSVTSIGNSAFSYNLVLESVIIPDTVTTIGESVFQSCPSIIYCKGETKKEGWSSNWNCGCLVYWGYINTVSDANYEYVVQKLNNVMQIAITKYKGDKTTTTTVTIRNSIEYEGENLQVTSISQDVFKGFNQLTSVTFPNQLTSIGNNAFGGCTKLCSIDLPNTVTSIGAGSFSGCFGTYSPSGLYTITLPSNLKSIGNQAFLNCQFLGTVDLSNTSSEEIVTGGSNMFLSSPTYLQHIYVPSSLVDTYRTAPGWSTYANKISAPEA